MAERSRLGHNFNLFFAHFLSFLGVYIMRIYRLVTKVMASTVKQLLQDQVCEKFNVFAAVYVAILLSYVLWIFEYARSVLSAPT